MEGGSYLTDEQLTILGIEFAPSPLPVHVKHTLISFPSGDTIVRPRTQRRGRKEKRSKRERQRKEMLFKEKIERIENKRRDGYLRRPL